VQSSRGGRSAAIFSSNQTLCVYAIARNTAPWLRMFQFVVVFENLHQSPRLTLRTHALPEQFGFVSTSIHAASDEAFRRLITIRRKPGLAGFRTFAVPWKIAPWRDSQKVRVNQRAQCAPSTGIVARSAPVTATRLRPRPPATDTCRGSASAGQVHELAEGSECESAQISAVRLNL
jgi:hypothetical protein